jgi:hypothetical protein
MTRDEFWKWIDKAADYAPFAPERVEWLLHKLSKESQQTIVGFGFHLNQVLDEGYNERLWAAAHILNRGCSEEGFEYFRGWLLLQGRRVYEQAVQTPETLADVPFQVGENETEEALYIASEAWSAAGYPEDEFDELYARLFGEVPDGPLIDTFSWTEATVEVQFPRLAAEVHRRMTNQHLFPDVR